MTKVDFTFHVALDDSEFIKVEDHLYTTRTTLQRQEPKIHMIDPCCLKILKEFEGQLSQQIVDEWLLLSRALDQACSYERKWDDHKILEELIAGKQHPVSWYVEHCRAN